MGIEHINRLGWIVIGAIVGALIGVVLSSSGEAIEGVATTDLSTFEQDVVQKDVRSGRPLVGKILIHPPEYSEVDESAVQLVTYKRLAMTKDGRYGWLDKRVVANLPYAPARRNAAAASDLTVEKYLESLASQHDFIDYSTGWWMLPRNAIPAGIGFGVVVIGGIWPTLLGLMSGAGLGRKYNPKYKDDRPLWRVKSTATAPGARPTVSTAEMARLSAVADAYHDNLAQHATAGSHAPAGTTQAIPEVKKLNAQQLEELKPLPNPDGDDDIEVKGEYYPVMFHHKKEHPDEPEGHHKDPGTPGG